MITLRRYIIVSLAAIFSAYQLLLATFSISIPRDQLPNIVAMALYALATIASLWPSNEVRMPTWMAASNFVVSVAVTLLVSSQLDVHGSIGSDYSTWYPAAIGTLMVITSTRRRHLWAWLGVGFLAVHTVIWAGPSYLGTLGVIGSVVWVAVSHILSWSLLRIGRDAQQFAEAERETTAWQAAQEAHLSERQVRLRQTRKIALPVLRQIDETRGELNEELRQECVYLEAAIRDEIRGRKLLNDRVRAEVMRARHRGSIVTLLDEGGLDDLGQEETDRVLNQLAEALADSDSDRLVARTGQEDSDVAVTLVGLSFADGGDASALGQDDDDQVDLWLEIPRSSPSRTIEEGGPVP
ncbi:MAG: hypothetical protein KF742_07625 [Cryobacterium sp.]|nr:hypothetical protein [Cryobacterium sp.]